MDRKLHWETVFTTKQATEVSWYQQTPKESLALLKELNIPVNASIVDIGAGDSFFVDHLLDEGYANITVLDISETAINKAKQRLGSKATKVNWVVSDVLDFKNGLYFDFWHDRASFHFFTLQNEVEKYISVVDQHLNPGGKMVVGTFSTEGPQKCSGLQVQQYNEETLVNLFQKKFKKIHCMTSDHETPFGTTQNFLFCSFKKENN
ncbi:class I SAM-dependent methyltransferase [Ferruginibacter lapsinanis]|uniref:class I SAM-dependent methyltransferase n=1 Tax=Ferruginibacter lapsinanis TaxID=563172 RepID=UPI001E33A2D0|nr:class I SAM-dependent methyltransferase [Ferruginibacter lapsinanis]UEG51062.1 class I SAM-dependent methyltransferase [Ferruginibacter lapsinanis]